MPPGLIRRAASSWNPSAWTYDEMYQKMYDAYHEAADQNEALIADVGKRYYEEAGYLC